MAPHLETPQVVLLASALVVLDVVILVVMNVVARGGACTSTACEIRHSGSVSSAVVALVLAAGTVVVTVGAAVVLRRAMRTVLVVQLVMGAILVTHANGLLSDAQAFRRHPTPTPSTLIYVPCAERTLLGQTCVSQAPQSGR